MDYLITSLTPVCDYNTVDIGVNYLIIIPLAAMIIPPTAVIIPVTAVIIYNWQLYCHWCKLPDYNTTGSCDYNSMVAAIIIQLEARIIPPTAVIIIPLEARIIPPPAVIIIPLEARIIPPTAAIIPLML